MSCRYHPSNTILKPLIGKHTWQTFNKQITHVKQSEHAAPSNIKVFTLTIVKVRPAMIFRHSKISVSIAGSLKTNKLTHSKKDIVQLTYQCVCGLPHIDANPILCSFQSPFPCMNIYSVPLRDTFAAVFSHLEERVSAPVGFTWTLTCMASSSQPCPPVPHFITGYSSTVQQLIDYPRYWK